MRPPVICISHSILNRTNYGNYGYHNEHQGTGVIAPMVARQSCKRPQDSNADTPADAVREGQESQERAVC